MKVGSHGEVLYFTAHPAWKTTLSQHSSVLKYHFPRGEKTSGCFVQPALRQRLWFWEIIFATIKSQKHSQYANETEKCLPVRALNNTGEPWFQQALLYYWCLFEHQSYLMLQFAHFEIFPWKKAFGIGKAKISRHHQFLGIPCSFCKAGVTNSQSMTKKLCMSAG